MGARIADVARLAGVSVATVSRALRDLPNVSASTRERVRDAADELHYVADPNAARLAGQRSTTIGLVVPMLSSWYHGRLFEGVERAAGAAGYDVLPYVLGSSRRVARFITELPFRKRVDGLVVADVPLDAESFERLTVAGTSVATCSPPVPGASSLRIDDRSAATEATRHLLALGHTEIAVIGGPQEDPFRFVVPQDRLAGVRDAMRAAGRELDTSLVMPGDYRATGGARAMSRLLERRRVPTGIVACSDEMAIGAINVARRGGLAVPEEISVIGFDDHDVARYVELTTVRQDVVGIGERLVELLVERMGDPGAPVRHELARTELVVRSTTGPAQGSAPRTTTAPVADTAVADPA